MECFERAGITSRSVSFLGRQALLPTAFLLAACGGGGDGDLPPNTPLTVPMALVVNQDDTTMTTVRLDGKGSPVINTLSLGPAQPDAIGGVTFSLGEWIFATHTAGNRVAFIDPIGALTPILEDFLISTTDPRIGQSPKRIYRDPVDKEVLWTMNEGTDPTLCALLGPALPQASVTVLHNSHIAVGGDKPHIKKTSCLWGHGEQFAAFSRPTAANQGLRQNAFISSKSTGLISQVKADPADGNDRWATGIAIDLCDSAKEACDASPVTPNNSAPAGMFWSQASGKIYCYLSGYGTVVEIDPATFAITRKVDLKMPPADSILFRSIGITPGGRFLFLVGEDVMSDAAKVLGKIGVVDLMSPGLSLTTFSLPQLDHIRPALFQFSPDGRRLYLTQSNAITGLPFGAQAHGLKLDKLLVFDPTTLPAAPSFLAEIDLPASTMHGLDVWAVGPQGAGSAKGIVITNATSGVNGSVSLIEAATHTMTSTIPVGKNPKHVTVYYAGLAASDNQATPTW